MPENIPDKSPSKLLIANRGEIACRVALTARRMGIVSVAVYSAVDSNALHVQQCDEAIALSGVSAAESYLDIAKILLAAKRCGAHMIHPGYGFLSENAEFAERCHAAGLIFIGPAAESIRIMGSKSAARQAVADAGVAVLLGYDEARQDEAYLQQQAREIGYPLLIKAVAGGGGKGMRMVEAADDLLPSLEAVQRESQSAFADARVMLEKFLPVARHIEVQIFADQHDNIVHLYERDCSMQRRHQKLVEESPACGMSDDLRVQMTSAAVACARAIDYVGAGTIEFLLAPDNTFYFMEMNTRLQVEHAVTEMVTRQDLVAWQIKIARGEPLPCTQAQLSLSGHAIEARIYAENPQQQFLPSTGTVHFIHHPTGWNVGRTDEQADIRVDSGIQADDVISRHYDPMISKLVVWGEVRSDALDKMTHALADYQILGVHHNITFLSNLINHRAFQQGMTATRFVESHYSELINPEHFSGIEQTENALIACDRVLALACCYELHRQRNRQRNRQQQADRWSPWSLADGWQNNLTRTVSLSFEMLDDYGNHGSNQNAHIVVGVEFMRDELGETVRLNLPTDSYVTEYQMTSANHIELKMDGHSVSGIVAQADDRIMLHYQARYYQLKRIDPRVQEQADEPHSGTLNAPMPGLIIALTVAVGETVNIGSPLLIIEAMKMEHQIKSPQAGVVKALNFAVDDQVKDGDALLVIE